MNENIDDHLPPYRVRPRFQIDLTESMEELSEKIKIGLAKDNAPCKGQVNTGYISLYLPEEEQHYWSPQLTLSLEATPQGTSLRGLYGPRPAVWTMFVFFYALIGFAIFVILIIGTSNLSLGKSGAILYLVPLLILVFLSLYLVAYFGQKLGHDQMLILQQFVEESTGLIMRSE